MEVCPISDVKIETVLIELRKTLLLKRHTLPFNTNLLRFQSSLALQCFTNEFLYEETEEEGIAVANLAESLQQSFSSDEELSFCDIACLATYRPLSDYPWTMVIDIPLILKRLFQRQVKEVNQELKLKAGITSLNPIKDNVSVSVQNQYEQNPYPRWINTKLETKALSVKEFIVKVRGQVTNTIGCALEAPQILIAGCGTGQHSLSTASRFKNSHVTAIDLSFSSLAYAKRKTEELGILNIDYLQGDILEIGILDTKFDVIESVGVLHHMADPVAGWKVLTNHQKPNGFMKIGLYSDLARQHIVKLRDMINRENIALDKTGIIDFRRQIIKLNDTAFNKLQNSSDFYSLSAVRDLLFHVQEHRFTIPKINKIIKELGLEFIGFEFENSFPKRKFKITHPIENSIYDLNKWHQHEILNPRLFAGMYQFWVQKM